ncbi:MAG: fumarate hydratase [Acholeplasmatales bacterium]|nr:fumarate hydratase [Acholeplasmatales bacterium]
MKEIDVTKIINEVKRLCIEAATYIEDDVFNVIKCAKNKECGLAKEILEQIIENDEIAAKENIPMCQDTGITVVFVEIGNDVHINGSLEDAINKGISLGYTEGYLRKSVVKSPLNRVNTKDNTPAIIHIKYVLGDTLKITICPKGAGSENMSKVKMLNPSDGIKGIKDFVLNTILEAGGRACPPLVVGIGIGGDMEKCALIAKEALLRKIDDESNDPDANKLEKELFEEINKLNVGPMGLGGKTTALAVKVNLYPCHIASLPVACNIQCHASRHKVVIL